MISNTLVVELSWGSPKILEKIEYNLLVNSFLLLNSVSKFFC